MKYLLVVISLICLDLKASEGKLDCHSYQRYSRATEYKIIEDQIEIKSFHYDSRNCTRPYQLDVERGYFIEEHESYLIVITYAESFPLDEMQKDIFDEEPEYRFLIQLRTLTIQKKPERYIVPFR